MEDIKYILNHKPLSKEKKSKTVFFSQIQTVLNKDVQVMTGTYHSENSLDCSGLKGSQVQLSGIDVKFPRQILDLSFHS